MAVGGQGNPNTGVASGTLAERWNGTRWRIQSTPNPSVGGWFLNAVSCTSPSACTAVGGRLASTPRPGLATLAERWNGRTWSIQPTPNPPGRDLKVLDGVACTSRSSCMAVGAEVDPVTGENLGTLAERWNGRTWRIVPTFKPAPTGPNAALSGVACTSASACTAVGGQTPARTLAERWNGRTWQVQATPNPAGAQSVTLLGVACPARTVCTAVGLNFTGFPPLTLAERWSGGRWRIQPTPSLGGSAFDVGFPSVACPTPAACTAAGHTYNSQQLTLAEQWNGAGQSAPLPASRSAPPGGLRSACFRAPSLQPPSAWGRTPESGRRWPQAATLPTPASAGQPTRLGWCPPI